MYYSIAHFFGSSVLFSFGDINKLYSFIKVFLDDILNFLQSDIEKFSALVYHIHLSILKSSMECRFKFWSIISENHGVNIKIERN